MMPHIYEFLATAIIGFLGWMFKLEPRLQVLDQKHSDLKELLEVKIDAKFEGLDKRLERIETALNGALHKD